MPDVTVTVTDRSGQSASATAAYSVGSGGLNLARVPWEGGPSYWSQFPKAHAAGWSNPSFFPIAVFLSKPETRHVQILKSLGINTYQACEHIPPLSAVTNEGMFVLPSFSEWTQAEIGNNPLAVGHFVSDECEMGYSGCAPEGSEFDRLAVQQAYCNTLRARNDGRFLQANFGNGVLRTWWGPNTMDDHVALMDCSSADKYFYTSPHVQDITANSPDWPGGPVSRAGAYGWAVDQMRKFQGAAITRPTWTFVETRQPLLTEAGARAITADEIDGAVWSSLIHEARGICYFQHNNDGGAFYSLVDGPQTLKDRVTQLNSRVKSLAPVLNTQSYVHTFNVNVDTMLKVHEGFAYVFAMPKLNKTVGSRTLTLPAGINGSSAEVLFENRSIPVTTSRTMQDVWAAENTCHIYKIAL